MLVPPKQDVEAAKAVIQEVEARLSNKRIREAEKFAWDYASDIVETDSTTRANNSHFRTVYDTILRLIFESSSYRQDIMSAHSEYIRNLRNKEKKQ